MNALPRFLGAILLACTAAAPTSAQDGASTLAALVDGADAAAVATVVAREETPTAVLLVRLQTTTALAGAAPATFALSEPAGACCGRSLFALQPGDVRLVFLQRRGAGWHLAGGPRGMLPATAAVLAHVQSLLAARTGAARSAALLAALDHDEARIADDAATALGCQPGLALDADGRQRIAALLPRELDRRSARGTALLEVAARCADAALRDAVLARYLDCPRDDEAELLGRCLLRTPVAGTIDLAVAAATDERRGLRVAALVDRLDADAATARGLAMLGVAPGPRVQLRLCEDLLVRGVPAEQLRAAPPTVVAVAQKRAALRLGGR